MNTYRKFVDQSHLVKKYIERDFWVKLNLMVKILRIFLFISDKKKVVLIPFND